MSTKFPNAASFLYPRYNTVFSTSMLTFNREPFLRVKLAVICPAAGGNEFFGEICYVQIPWACFYAKKNPRYVLKKRPTRLSSLGFIARVSLTEVLMPQNAP